MLRILAAIVLVATVAPRALSQAILYDWHGNTTFQYFGRSGCIAGDVDRDGVEDVIAGGNGDARVFSGRTGAVLLEWTAADGLGDVVGAAGDVNADGWPDLLACDPLDNGSTGIAYVYSGQDGALLHSLQGSAKSVLFGQAVTGLGDVDGDGSEDFAIGAPLEGFVGHVRGYSGASGAQLYDILGGGFFAVLGYDLARLDDVNGDGIDDGVATARDYALVFSGATGGEITRFSPGPSTLVDCSATPDLDGDLHLDVLVCDRAWKNASGQVVGSVCAFSSATGALLDRIEGQTPDHPYGDHVASVGDVNGDGSEDILIRDFDSAHGRVLSGRTKATLYEFGAYDTEDVGSSIGRCGDLDGDGLADMLVGVETFQEPGTGNLGAERVYRGGALFLSAAIKAVVDGDLETLTLGEGTPNRLAVIALVEIDGVPTFSLLGGLGALDATGRYSLGFTVPSGIAGHTFVCVGYADDASGRPIGSAREVVVSR